MANEPQKVERITSAEATRRPKGVGRRLKETFLAGADARSTWDYVVVDVIIPETRDLVYNVFEAGLQRIFYGDMRPRSRGPISTNNQPRVEYPYHSMHPGINRGRQPQQPALSRRARARGSFDEIIVPSRREAEEVIDRMFDVLSQYGQVSVAQLLDLTGIQSSHTDIKWGWTQLRGAKAVPLRGGGGYLLDLPEPEPFA